MWGSGWEGGGLFWPIACFVELTSCRSHPSYLHVLISPSKIIFLSVAALIFLKTTFWPECPGLHQIQKMLDKSLHMLSTIQNEGC